MKKEISQPPILPDTNLWREPLFYALLIAGWLFTLIFVCTLIAIFSPDEGNGPSVLNAIATLILGLSLSFLAGYAFARSVVMRRQRVHRGFEVVIPKATRSDGRTNN